ncbi:hypothetical protein GCM10025868_22680 [Angustibacter aerolatus]|uniref:Leucine-binding protein domain-containing protein n=1 Tax=Angustibacter aerolatus TaxID=1162965 RepID=A0ABQ6JI05_9ACTN|nr:hypothetical protein GCM10025868_22680 [Angustibacter aerolatus]
MAAYKAAYEDADPAEDAADAYAAAEVLAAATKAVGKIDQTKISEWLHANEVSTILGPLAWEQTGEPKGNFLLAQWQSGTVQVVAPKEAATTDKTVNSKPGWK